ncbi:MAG: hypothetical protein ACHQ50_13340 [Fimbriimonadales bacterium]
MSALSKREADERADAAEARAFCKKHHIDYDRWGVWLKRSYDRWRAVDHDGPLRGDDLAPVREAYRGLKGLSSTLSKARQSDGWIIPRYGEYWFAYPLNHIYPEIRPDNKVKRAGLPGRHYHGDRELHPELYPKVWPEEGWTMMPWEVFTPEEMKDHIKRDKGDPDDHRGINVHHVHEYDHWAKYCFAENVTIKGYWPHDHANKGSATLEKHLAARTRQHGKDRDGWHWHWDWVKDPDQNLAKRIDVHPIALGLFRNAPRRVHWPMEGCIKSDAVLTEILEEGLAESVLSVPSVTLWDAKELPEVARNLRGQQIVLSVDADGGVNPRVMTQARLFQTVLTQLGCTALVTAPPFGAWLKDHNLKGDDDHLAAGGKLEDLEVLGLDPSRELDEFVEDRGRHLQYRVQRRLPRLVHSLSMHATEGRFTASIPALARVLEPGRDWSAFRYWRKPIEIDDTVKARAMQRHRNTDLVKEIQRDLDVLEEIGAIRVEGNRETARKFWRGKEGWRDSKPTIVIDRQLRATESRRKLGK